MATVSIALQIDVARDRAHRRLVYAASAQDRGKGIIVVRSWS
jgi:hypothetical protein